MTLARGLEQHEGDLIVEVLEDGLHALADAYLAEGQVVVRMTEFGIPIPRFLIFAAEDPVTVTFKIRLHSK